MAKPTRRSTKGVTKKHLARLEREQLQTRFIVIGTILVVVLVFIFIGYGFLDQKVLQPNRPVAKVGGSTIPLSEFQANVRYQNVNIYQSYQNIVQYIGEDQSFYQQYQNAISNLGPSVQEALVEDRLIRQEAARRHITVSKADLDQAIQGQFGYYPSGTPTSAPTSSPVPTQPTSTLSPLQLTLVPYTPTPTLKPTVTGTISPTATLAPSSTPTTVPLTVTKTITPTATAGPSPTATTTSTPFPTSTPYTLQAFNSNYQNYTKGLSADQISISAFRRIIESQLYRQKVQAALIADPTAIPADQEYVWARHILVSSEISATEIISKLNQGENFATLAAKYSIDTGTALNGGDLGYFPHGQMVAPFDKAVFAIANIGDYTKSPVASIYGYHIIQLLGRENRPFKSDSEKFQYWIYTQKQAIKITISTDAELVNLTPPLVNLPTPQPPATQSVPQILVTPQVANTPKPPAAVTPTP